LFPGQRVEKQKGFTNLRAQACYSAPQLHDAAGVTAIADHLVDAGGAQSRVLLESLADELCVRINHGGAQWLSGAAEALRLDGVATGSGMLAQLTGDGADLPVLGVKVAANLGADFGAEHEDVSPSPGNRRKRIQKTARTAANTATQPQNGSDRSRQSPNR